jgi:general secretion pathway protein N
MKKRVLVLAGIASFLITAVSQVPAHWVTQRAAMLLPVTLQGVSGTLWQGSVHSVIWQNVQLRRVQWDFQVLALLRGKAAVNVQAQWVAGGTLNAICALGVTGAVQCEQMNLADIPAQSLSPYLQRYQIPPLRGQLQAALTDVAWKQGSIPQANGTLTWQQAGITQSPQVFGDYNAILTVDEESGQQLTLSSAPAAALTLDGSGQWQPDGKYQFALNLQPIPTAVSQLSQGLSWIAGAPRADGRYHIEKQGSLPIAR